METGILKQIDLKTTNERYFFVEAQRRADRIWIRSIQAFKPLELAFKVSDLRISHDQASAAWGSKKYEFNDDTGGLLTQLKTWVH
ncbi:hypothetical protein D1831_07485 [Lactiplantibacillus garii]|uniref:PH domain-containing protein n=1 Tax=Lactiplantibacillus garii TaxID=2306423 RepID=A0A426D728_9LACO|nr:hypothetical protein [Lactiplantibacillus garii]RRK10391.1 hypothetical protein D1831_07485 [Lactiplantibacillus garii]